MRKYIGLDLHPRSFVLYVLDEGGTRLFEQSGTTSGQALVGLVSNLKGRIHLAVEESTLADWAFRTLSPYADVMVTDPRRNRLMAGDENMSDGKAAKMLAEMLRQGLLHRIHHSESAERQAFKELVQAYHSTSAELARHKNKLKAQFRRRAIDARGASVYKPEDRAHWNAKFPEGGAPLQVQLLWGRVDHLQQEKDCLLRQIAVDSKRFVQIARFQAVPGVGLIRATTFFSFIDTPDRFATRGKLWTYCGIGIASKRSGEGAPLEHLTHFGNRVLKDIAKGAALSAAHAASENRFASKYERLLGTGKAPEIARLDVARSVITTLWAMWRKDEEYKPTPAPRAQA
jgi:transposase